MTLERFIDEITASEDKNEFASNINIRKKTKLTFQEYSKQINKKLKKDGRAHLIPYMKDKYYQALYNKSGYAKRKIKIRADDKQTISINDQKIKRIKIKRNGKIYKRTIQPRWTNTIALKEVITYKPRSKEYNEFVQNIVESTGRTRQAVVKKIQRTRKNNDFSG